MTRRMVPALLAAALLPFAAAPAVASSPDRSQPAPRAAAQVRILATSSPFSPNGDGHHDRVAVRYRLTDAARISVEVTHRGKTVLHTAPKAVRAGKRSFTWDGTRANGKRVADGRYRVTIHAAAHGTTRTDSTTVAVRTAPTRVDAGVLKLNSDTVYPYATVINDVVVGNFNLTTPIVVGDKDLRRTPERVVSAVRAQVLDKAGHVISVEPLTVTGSRAIYMDDPDNCGWWCGRFTWDGRDSDGVRQAPGTYAVRVVLGRDAAGNARVLTPTRKVIISRAQLEPKTTIVELGAAATPTTHPYNPGCNGCGAGDCASTNSIKYPGGLTFDNERSGCSTTYEFFTTPVPGRRTPYDRFTVTATGGPTTEGLSASAVLQVGVWPEGGFTYPMKSATTTTSDTAMTPNSEVYPTGWPQAVIWSVRVSDGSYDVTSFKVEMRTYVPAA